MATKPEMPPKPPIGDRIFFIALHLLCGVVCYDVLWLVFLNGLMLGFNVQRLMVALKNRKEHSLWIGIKRIAETPTYREEGKAFIMCWLFPTPQAKQLIEKYVKK